MSTALSSRVALPRQSRKAPAETELREPSSSSSTICTRRSGAAYGSGRRSAASNALKIVAVPQTASAMVPMTTAEKVGHLASNRTA